MITNKRMVLRFRDLVTELGGTISEHRSILRSYGSVWWGWMMRQQELVPRDFFCSLKKSITQHGSVDALLYDTGRNELLRCELWGLAVAPQGTRIGPPEPEKTPEYYNRGRYPAWFSFKSIEKAAFAQEQFYFDSFPTKANYLPLLINTPVTSLEELRHQDVTLWVFRERSDS